MSYPMFDALRKLKPGQGISKCGDNGVYWVVIWYKSDKWPTVEFEIDDELMKDEYVDIEDRIPLKPEEYISLDAALEQVLGYDAWEAAKDKLREMRNVSSAYYDIYDKPQRPSVNDKEVPSC